MDAISSIYHSDNANYFILESQNTLSQFIERIHHKPDEIQQKLFQLLEFIVFQLNFVPCKELISLSIFLKTHSLTQVNCSIMCLQSLLNILKHNVIFKDVYREVGMLEVFVTCLSRYADMLHDKNNDSTTLETQHIQLGMLIMEALTILLSGNINNANVFRESGGAKCIHHLINYVDCRHVALGIIRELILTSGGEEDMATLLGTMHTTPRSALRLKIDILRALLSCLRDSHRTRTVFRKVGGFVYVTSVLVALENRLTHRGNNDNESNEAEVLGLLHIVFHTIR